MPSLLKKVKDFSEKTHRMPFNLNITVFLRLMSLLLSFYIVHLLNKITNKMKYEKQYYGSYL